jgi:hypothetical protein
VTGWVNATEWLSGLVGGRPLTLAVVAIVTLFAVRLVVRRTVRFAMGLVALALMSALRAGLFSGTGLT